MSNRNQYGLFAGHHYYPQGGVYDWRGFGDTIDELMSRFSKNGAAWATDAGGSYVDAWGHIVDMDTMQIVLLCSIPFGGRVAEFCGPEGDV